MANIRFSLLVKLAIIFLAVMVVPAAIVAVYVKQQFDAINLQNRLESLDYGRASLSALLDEEWRTLRSLSRTIQDSGALFPGGDLQENRDMLDGARGIILYDAQGRTYFDSSLDCCDPEILFSTLFPDPADFTAFASSGATEVQQMTFQNDRIVLLHGFASFRDEALQGFTLIQSEIASYVFDALRRVSGLKTSIYRVYSGEEMPVDGQAGEADGSIVLEVGFSTAINEYAERIEQVILPGEAWDAIRNSSFISPGAMPWESELFYDAGFITTIDNTDRVELAGFMPLLRSGASLFVAEVTIPREQRGSPEEIEYLWVIISALFILVLLMSLLITMYVVAPIITLNQGVESLRKSIGSERGFEELPVQSNDEIGDLATSFNLLARELTVSLDKIRQQRREILEYAQNLEDKVKERTQEAEAARVRAEMANVHKSKFLVNMNHEFRTPLNSISGITDLLSYGAYDKNDDMALLLEELAGALGERAPRILGELRDFLFEDSNGLMYLYQLLKRELDETEMSPDLREQAEQTLLSLDALIREEERGKLKAYNNISEAGKTLIHIVDDVINLSRIESGAIDIHPEACFLSEIVNYAMVHSESYCRAKGKTALISMSHRIDPDIPDRIIIDHYRVKQVLMNLMSNAIKYTESGEVELAVSAVENGRRKNLRFAVIDQGIGIDPKDHHLIFREFGRTFKVRDIEGTGLGLAISRKLVEAHGGKVGFQSSPGVGSEFWFTLPLELPGN
jgi:signal transduction histidine kinase